MYLYLILPVALVLLLIYYTYTIQMSTRNMPPGPFVVPILGSVPSVLMRKPTLAINSIRPWEYFDMLSKEFGDLFSCCVFNFDAVIITSYDLFIEVANMEEYSMKLAHELLTYPRTFGKELGLIFAASPPLWTEMRKFTVRTLREFGFGKMYTMHSVIIDEVNVLMSEFRKKMKSDCSGVIRFRNTFSLSVLNVLWCMVAGIRYEHDDPRLLKLLDHTFKMSKSVTFSNPNELLIPFTRKFAPWLWKADLRYKTFDECHLLSKSLIEERKADGFYLNDPQNYIDVFLKKIHETKDDKNSLYTEQQLQSMIVDLLLVGSLTLNATLNYGVLYLILNPEIQKKCQEEIDSIVSRHMAPTVEDVEKMPYFQAFILETHRCANVVPNPVPRLVPKDWNLKGYHIPKGTVILSNHFSVNKDVRNWGDPDVFRPDRFINEKGEFVPDPRVAVFGFGKRICIGIHLVNSILPLFFASLLQNFTFSVVPGTKPPTTEPEIGVSLSPQEFSAQLTVRELQAKDHVPV